MDEDSKRHKENFIGAVHDQWAYIKEIALHAEMVHQERHRGGGLEGLQLVQYVLFQTFLTSEYKDVALWLIESKVIDVNKRSSGEWSPCIWASYRGRVKVLRALIGAGADVNKADICEQNALDIAVNRGYIECMTA